MIIGVLKETVEGEFRVAATPETVKKLINVKAYSLCRDQMLALKRLLLTKCILRQEEL